MLFLALKARASLDVHMFRCKYVNRLLIGRDVEHNGIYIRNNTIVVALHVSRRIME